VRSTAVVVGKKGGQPGSACCAVGIASGVRPFSQASLDESLGLTIGLRSVGASEGVLDTQGLTGTGKELGSVSTAVVSQHPLDVHTQGPIVRYRRFQERNGGGPALVTVNISVRRVLAKGRG